MKLTTLKLGLLAFGLFVYSQTASAQDQQRKPDPEKMFKGLDANKDGLVTMEEFKNKKRKNEVPLERLEKMFVRMDADSNGSITSEEHKNAMAKMNQKKSGDGMKKKKQEAPNMEGNN